MPFARWDDSLSAAHRVSDLESAGTSILGKTDDALEERPTLDEEDQAVLMSLGNEKYVLRSIAGIVRDTQYTDVRVVYILESLRDKNLVARKKGKSKQLYWLTPNGRQIANDLIANRDA